MKMLQANFDRTGSGIGTGLVPEIRGGQHRFVRPGACAAPGGLTRRQKEILQRVAEGKANKQTASELCISEKTVDHHRQRLMNKLRIRGTAGLTRYAIAMGII